MTTSSLIRWRRFAPPRPLLVVSVIVVFVHLLLEFAFRIQPTLVSLLQSGMFAAEFGFVIMFGGLWGRSWISGWLLATSWLMIGIGVAVIGNWLNGFPTRLAGAVLFIPAVTISGCAPLVVCRSLFGWSLTRTGRQVIPRTPSNVEDLFLFGILVACAITLCKLAFEGTSDRGAEFLVMIFSAVVSSVLVPVAYITFRSTSWPKRLVAYSALVAILLAFFGGLGALFGGSWSDFSSILCCLISLSAVALSGVAGTLASGYRMTRYEPKANVSSDSGNSPSIVTSSDENSPSASRVRKLARLQTVGFVLTTFVCIAGGALADRSMVQVYTQLTKPDVYFQAPVESIDIREEAVVEVVMSSKTTAEDIVRVAARAPKLERLSLRGVQLTDESIHAINRIGRLLELDLSNSSINDAQLRKLTCPQALMLADTQVTFQTAIEHAKLGTTVELDLSGTNTNDASIASCQTPHRLTVLRLARNPITDTGVKALLDNQILPAMLDLSDTQAIGLALQHPACPNSVVMDGTPITDAAVNQLMTSGTSSCMGLSLRRTSVTAAVLPVFAGRSLALGHCKISESDLMALSNLSFVQLKLNGPEFTGEAVAAGRLSVQKLDLSDSKVTDSVLERFVAIPRLQELILRRTQVSMGGVKFVLADTVNLSQTSIQGAEVLRAQNTMRPYRIHMRHESFSPKELTRLRGSKIYVDGPRPWTDW